MKKSQIELVGREALLSRHVWQKIETCICEIMAIKSGGPANLQSRTPCRSLTCPTKRGTDIRQFPFSPLTKSGEIYYL